MALTDGDYKRMADIVEGAVSKAMLAHLRDCPLVGKVDTLFKEGSEREKKLNGIAAGLTRIEDARQAEKKIDAAEKRGMSRGMTIALTILGGGVALGGKELIIALQALLKGTGHS